MLNQIYDVKVYSSDRTTGISALGEEVPPLNGTICFYTEDGVQKGWYECHGRADAAVTRDEMKEIEFLDDSHVNFRVDVDGQHENWYNMALGVNEITGTCVPYPYHFVFPQHFEGITEDENPAEDATKPVQGLYQLKALNSDRALGAEYSADPIPQLCGILCLYGENGEQKGYYESTTFTDGRKVHDEILEVQRVDKEHLNFRIDVEGYHENWYNMILRGKEITGTCVPYPYHFLFPLHLKGKARPE